MIEDIWSIIGLSSIISAIVSITLGFVSAYVLERSRFAREQKTTHLKNQIQLLSRMHSVLVRIQKNATDLRFYEDEENEIKELNSDMKGDTTLLPQELFNDWNDIWIHIRVWEREEDPKKKIRLGGNLGLKWDSMIAEIQGYHNHVLLPKYRKIVGDTINDLRAENFRESPFTKRDET